MNPMCDHLSCREAQCPDCGFQVDAYGNVDDGSGRLEYCCFPDCGCDGARLCMASGGCSVAAACLNLERGARLSERIEERKGSYHTGVLISMCRCTVPSPRNTRDKHGRPFQRCSKCWKEVRK